MQAHQEGLGSITGRDVGHHYCRTLAHRAPIDVTHVRYIAVVYSFHLKLLVTQTSGSRDLLRQGTQHRGVIVMHDSSVLDRRAHHASTTSSNFYRILSISPTPFYFWCHGAPRRHIQSFRLCHRTRGDNPHLTPRPLTLASNFTGSL